LIIPFTEQGSSSTDIEFHLIIPFTEQDSSSTGIEFVTAWSYTSTPPVSIHSVVLS